jgi:inosine triphosphate pyrophosphatase
MAYGMLSSYGKANRGISAAAAVLRGYNSVYPLTLLEREHLVLLMTCRLACSATLGAYTYSQNPGNTYLLLHSEPAWKALEMIWCGNDTARRLQMKAAMNRFFDQACSYRHDTAQEDGREAIPCFDLVCPDPCVVDLLSSVRVVDSSHCSSTDTAAAASSATSEHLAKKQKTAFKKDNDDNKTVNYSGNLPVVTFVTGNAKKLEEVKRILQTTNGDNNDSRDDDATKNARLPIHLVNQSLDLPELQGDDVLAIARDKCLVASQQVPGGSAVIIEDTSLCFNALNGLPGPYIKWFLDSCGHDGLNRMLAGFEDKTAYAQTVVAYCPARSHGSTTTTTMADVVVFSGRTNGTIVPARGKLDFGWDPIFEPLESAGNDDDSGSDGNAKKKTYAEMTKDEKDSISHRSRAFAQLREYLVRIYSVNEDNT